MTWFSGTKERGGRQDAEVSPDVMSGLERLTREVHQKQMVWLQSSMVTRWFWVRKQIYPIASEAQLNGTVYSLGDVPILQMATWFDEVLTSCRRQGAIGYVSSDRTFAGHRVGNEIGVVPTIVSMLYVLQPKRRCCFRIEQQLQVVSEGFDVLEPIVGRRQSDGDEWVWSKGSEYSEFQQLWPARLR